MTTHLRTLYEMLKHFSTATHQGMCQDLLRKLEVSSGGATLASWFNEALTRNSVYSNIDQPFMNAQSLASRKPIGPDSKGDNRIAHLLSSRGEVEVKGGPEGYRFRYLSRQIAPLRQEGAGDPTSGAGGIDYTARTQIRPVLGEIKAGSDENPFYALVQLLTYLSEFAGANQIARANKHHEFELLLTFPQPFDLHILLADFNDRGEKGEIIEPARRLALQFKRRLLGDFSSAAKVVGNILCLRMDSTAFSASEAPSLNCIWAV